MEEPSVLDYVLSRINPWSKKKIEFPSGEPSEVLPVAESESSQLKSPFPGEIRTSFQVVPETGIVPIEEPAPVAQPVEMTRQVVIPWRALLGLVLALLAQLSLEPSPARAWQTGAILYLVGVGFAVLAAWRGEWLLAAPAAEQPAMDDLPINQVRDRSCLYWGAAISLALIAFLAFTGNRFTTLNLFTWLGSILLLTWGLWQRSTRPQNEWDSLRKVLSTARWSVIMDRWQILLLLAGALVIFFRVSQLNTVPPEMVSDHAEKLLDIWDINHGQLRIFFERNTGREALQMYLTAGIIQLFNTGYSLLSLKLGTVLAGLLTLPFIYLLGKELGNRRVGLLGFIFAGIAYWPNVISRVGLRFPFYPLFVAPVMYYLMRGLRTRNRNDFILAGVFLGIGLHGYTPIRILPFVVIAAIALYILHQKLNERRSQAISGLFIIGLVSFVLFIPLFRYSLENPEMFSYRSFTRLGSVERSLPGPAGEIFLTNLWRAVSMFAWDDGEIWVNSVTHRPALDVVSAALFYLGVGLLLFRYARDKNWSDLFLILSVPLLLMPSILSLAFPAENPALNRMGGAIVPVFIVVGFALDGIMTGMRKQMGDRLGGAAAAILACLLLLISSRQNYDLVFNQYQSTYQLSSWNTSEMGGVIQDFASSFGSPDTAWVLAFPHWVDTRLVGMNAGFPLRDYAIWADNLPDTVSEPRAKLFLVKPDDTSGLQSLRGLYPGGILQTFTSSVEGHNFLIFFVPASSP